MAVQIPAILFYVPNWLGDAVMATPALRAARATWPDHKLLLIGTPAACGVLHGLPHYDETMIIPPGASFSDMIRIARNIRKRYRVDTALILPHSFRAALLAWMSGAIRRVGLDRNGRRWLLTEPVVPKRDGNRIIPEYMVIEYLRLVEAAGGQADGAGPGLSISERARQRVSEVLPPDTSPVVALAPGAAFGPSKRWYPERFAATADQLAHTCGATCVLLTGPGEESIREAVRQAVRVPLVEIQDGGIELLKAVIARADLLITNDSGPRHIAVALGTTVVCVMGPTSEDYTESPWEKGELIRTAVPCAPCQQPVCPLEHHACMREITVDMVVNTARKWLTGRAEKSRLSGDKTRQATDSSGNMENNVE